MELTRFSARFFFLCFTQTTVKFCFCFGGGGFFFFWKTRYDLEKTPLFCEKMKTGRLFVLASEDSAVQSLNELDHSGVTETPAAAEDATLVGFRTLLT